MFSAFTSSKDSECLAATCGCARCAEALQNAETRGTQLTPTDATCMFTENSLRSLWVSRGSQAVTWFLSPAYGSLPCRVGDVQLEAMPGSRARNEALPMVELRRVHAILGDFG